MSIYSTIAGFFTGSRNNIIDSISNVFDEYNLSDEEKQGFKLKMEELLQKRDAVIQDGLVSEMEAKERVIVAELQQGDNFTKRARPMVVYAGLAFIFINHVLFPIIANITKEPLVVDLALPERFWWGWTAIVSTWSIGRTMEKKGSKNSIVKLITGG